MHLARVLKEGIGNLILNKLFKDEEHLNDFLEMRLEIKPELGDLDLINKTQRTKEFNFEFYLKDKKYELYICCFILADEGLVPYYCSVVERGE